MHLPSPGSLLRKKITLYERLVIHPMTERMSITVLSGRHRSACATSRGASLMATLQISNSPNLHEINAKFTDCASPRELLVVKISEELTKAARVM